MKILFLPAYFTPEHAASPYLGENRNQAFAEAGYKMIVITPIPTRGVSNEVYQSYKKNAHIRAFFLNREPLW